MFLKKQKAVVFAFQKKNNFCPARKAQGGYADKFCSFLNSDFSNISFGVLVGLKDYWRMRIILFEVWGNF